MEQSPSNADREGAVEEFDRFCRFIDSMHMSGTFVENDFMSKPIQKLIRTALSEKQAVPPGWKLVPEEPTEEMISAGEKQIDLGYRDLRTIYDSILAAAPKPPEKVGGDEYHARNQNDIVDLAQLQYDLYDDLDIMQHERRPERILVGRALKAIIARGYLIAAVSTPPSENQSDSGKDNAPEGV